MSTHTRTDSQAVTEERLVSVVVEIRVEHAPHLLHAVDQVLTALTNAGVEAVTVSAYLQDEP